MKVKVKTQVKRCDINTNNTKQKCSAGQCRAVQGSAGHCGAVQLRGRRHLAEQRSLSGRIRIFKLNHKLFKVGLLSSSFRSTNKAVLSGS